ncbi:hypothetical protein, partial [Escherichia coli]
KLESLPPRYIAEKNYMEALLKKASPHTVR